MNPLSISQIEEARIKVLENATELVEEAELLLRKKRFARAYALAHLACEEMAKIPMLVRIALDVLTEKEVDWKKLDRRLRSHTEKIRGILHIDFLTDPNIENDEDIKRLFESLEKIPDYNKVKNDSIYAGFVDNNFFKPSEVISANQAAGLVKLARSRLSFFEAIELPSQGKLEEIAQTPFFKILYEQFREFATSKEDKK